MLPSVALGRPLGAAPLVDARHQSSIAEMLRLHARVQGDAVAYRFLHEGEIDGPVTEWTFDELDRRARAIARGLERRGARGRPVLLLYPSGLDFVAGFFGALYNGSIAVPAYPPSAVRLPRTVSRLQAIVDDAGAEVVLTTGAIAAMKDGVAAVSPRIGAMQWVATDGPAGVRRADLDERISADPLPREDRGVAFLQYTSGSTGDPKGVVVTHANILHNLAVMERKLGCSVRGLKLLAWLPLFHDMGLIGIVLQSMRLGTPCTLMDPLAFLRRPARWLRAMSHYGAGVSAAPNFGYEYCVERVRDDEIAGIDLSAWRGAVNGAEPVRRATIERFVDRFSRYGLPRDVFRPSYGMAEATLLVASSDEPCPPRFLDVDARALAANRVEAPANEGASHSLVSCGRPVGEAIVVNRTTRRALAEREVGEVWLKSPSVGDGYWNRPELTRETFGARTADGEGPYLRTGDLGFFDRGELFITGRQKDLIIVRGRNYYPQDIEYTVEVAHPGVRTSCVAAFSVEADGEEQLAVAFEIEPKIGRAAIPAVIAAVRERIAVEHEIFVHEVRVVKGGSLPKTSSGKIQRSAARRLDPADVLLVVTEPAGRNGPAQRPAAAPGAADWRSLEGDARRALLREIVRETVEESLSGAGAIDGSAQLGSLGLDSLRRVEFLLACERRLEADLDPDLFAPEVTLDALADRLGAHLASPRAVQGAREAATAGEPLPLLYTQAASLRGDGWGSRGCAITLRVEVPADIDPEALEGAVLGLEGEHDALRTRPVSGSLQRLQPGEASVVHERRELTGDSGPGWREAQEAALSGFAQRFDLQRGPLVQSCHLSRGQGLPGMLLLAMHNHVADALTVTILVSDIERGVRERAGGGTKRHHGKRVTFESWLRDTKERAASPAVSEQLDYWRGVGRRIRPASRAGGPELIAGPERLSVERTDRFRARFASASEQHDALLAAFACAWAERGERGTLDVVLEHHGRTPAGGRDVSRTAGQFVYRYPLHLGALSPDIEEARAAVRNAVAAVPDHGRGFGLLRYAHPRDEVRAATDEIPIPRARFVYRGDLEPSGRGGRLFTLLEHGLLVPEETKRRGAPVRPHELALFGQIQGGCLEWYATYSSLAFSQDEADRIVARIGASLAQMTAG